MSCELHSSLVTSLPRLHRSPTISPYNASLPPRCCCCIAHTVVHAYMSTFPSPLPVVLSLSSSLRLTRTTRPRPSWRHPVWQDRPADKRGGARVLRCHLLGLRAAPTFGPKDKSDEPCQPSCRTRRLPVCCCLGVFLTMLAADILFSASLSRLLSRENGVVIRETERWTDERRR